MKQKIPLFKSNQFNFGTCILHFINFSLSLFAYKLERKTASNHSHMSSSPRNEMSLTEELILPR